MKKLLPVLFIVFAFVGCKRQAVELVTINASAYLDGNKAIGNFALLKPEQVGIFSDEDALDRFFATVQVNSKIAITEFSEKVIPGEYILVIQLKDGNPGVLYKTYTYNFITTTGSSARSNYVMQFQTGRTMEYQPWVDKK